MGGQNNISSALPYNFFNLLDSLTVQNLTSIIKCNSNSVYIDKLSPIIKIITDLNNKEDISIAELFYEKMTIKSDFTSSSKIKQYDEIFTFIKKHHDFLPLDKKKMVLEFFEKLKKHWTTYTIDIDSSLIGLVPTDALIHKLSNDTNEPMLSNKDIEKIMKDEDFVTKIIKWSSIENSTDLMKQVRHQASLFRGVDKSKKGDILIVRFTTNTQQVVAATNNISTSASLSSLSNGLNLNHNSSSSSSSPILSAIPSPTTQSSSSSSSSSNTLPSQSSSSNLSTTNLSSTQARSYFSKTKIIPNRISSTFKKSLASIPIITLDDYCKRSIKPIIHIGSSSSSSSSNSNSSSAGASSASTNFELKSTVRKIFNQKQQFARYSGERIGSFLLCYFSSEETEAVAVPIDSVLLLSKSVIEKIKENDKALIRKSIHQPSDDFNRELVAKVKEATVKYLIKDGIDLRFAQAETINTPNLLSLKKIKQMDERIKSILSDNQHQLYQDLEEQINQEINSFLLSINTRQFYMPSYGITISEFKSSNPLSMCKSKLHQTHGEIELALEKLSNEKRYYLDNTRKDECADWWLKKVETRCHDFLVARGFKLDALPDSYIEQQPSNLQDVYVNLHIIKQILKFDPSSQIVVVVNTNNANNTNNISPGTNRKRSTSGGSTPRPTTPTPTPEPLSFSPVSLIKELQDEIYPVISEFTKKCHAVFCDQFGLDQFTDSQSMKLVLKERQLIMTEKLYSQFENLLSDLDYLKEMEKQENSKDGSFHIVPISGLTIGLFARFENELVTAIELWSPEGGQYYNKYNNNDNNNTTTTTTSPTATFTVSFDDSSNNNNNNNNHSNRYNHQHQYSDGVDSSPLTLTINKPMISNGVYYNLPDSTTSTTTTTTTLTINRSPNATIIKEDKSQLVESILTENAKNVEETLKILQLDNDKDTMVEIINEVGNNGWTPLMYACSVGNSESAMLLLNIPGIDVNAKNLQGGNAIHFIVRHKCTDKRKLVINKLLSKGVDINGGSNCGETPLHSASLRGQTDTIKFLIDNGANIYSTTHNLETPLHYAVSVGRLDVVKLLIGHGAKLLIEMKSRKRGTALDLSRSLKYVEITALLEAHLNILK